MQSTESVSSPVFPCCLGDDRGEHWLSWQIDQGKGWLRRISLCLTRRNRSEMLALLRPIDASMSKLTLKRAVLLALAVLLCKATFAQSISNTFTLSFDKTIAPLVDLTGEFSPTNQTIISSVGDSVPLSFGGLIITNTGTGKLKGVSVVPILAQIGDAEPFAANYKVNGSITGGGTSQPGLT